MDFSIRTEYFPLSVESDLKYSYQRCFKRAFFMAAILHFVAIGTYWGIVMIQTVNRVHTIRIIDHTDLKPPPALTDAPPTPEVEVAASAKPVIGIPEPVDDTEVSAEMTIATQTEMSQSIAPVVQETEETQIIIEAPREEEIVVDPDVLPSANEFVPFEEPAIPIVRPKPEYPELAKKAGVEGMVVLKVLVDKEGKVRNVTLIKGLGAGLDKAAIKSAWASKWTPAIQNDKPVAVWMSYPVRFNLR